MSLHHVCVCWGDAAANGCNVHRVLVSALCLMSRVPCFRTGFYAEALPFTLKGIGGSGAPHYFAFERRVDSGPFAFDRPKSMA